MADRLDVVIFGASGFTGKATVIEAVKILSKLSWGIAGRSKDKLEAVLKEAGEKNEIDLSKIPILLADVSDADSLEKMANRAKVIVNCCGPYRFYGEPVVKACINAGTHHVDVSGEVQFIERMQLEYNDLAKEKGVYIISTCGFDSIPAEIGLLFFERHFDGQVNSIESYLTSWISGGYKGGASVHYGTWESAVYSLGFANEIRQVRSKLFAERLPSMDPKLKKRGIVHKSPGDGDLWCVPFPGSDASVVARSQRFLYETEKKRPIQYKEYLGVRSLPALLVMMLTGLVFLVLAKFSFGRKLLLDYPRVFSFGQFSHEGPTEDARKRTKFSLTFYGEGWPKEDQLAEPTDQHTSLPTKRLVTRVSGTDPGYTATGTALLLSATTILNEHTKMPGRGGVLSPGAAFAKTNIIEELSKNGFDFEVIGAEEETKVDE